MTARNCVALGVLAWLSSGTIANASPGSWAGTSLTGNNPSASGTYTQNAISNAPIAGVTGPVPALIAPDPAAQLPPPPIYTGPTTAVPNNAQAQSAPATQTLNAAPAAATATNLAAPPASAPYDAVLNFGPGPYPEQSNLTTGGAQPWYLSPVVDKFFNGVPNTQQQTGFEQAVLQNVQKTFQLSGLTPSLTLNTSAPANHVMSEVSGASYGPNPQAIGITDVGANGFGFIDKLGGAQTLDQLEWAIAHNLTHELMHAFGVAVHHDTTGTYLDAATATMSLLTDPNATLSPAAAQDILAHDYGRTLGTSGTPGAEQIDGDQMLATGPQPVPEPTTIAFWAIASLGLVVAGKRSSRRQAAH